VTYGPAPLSERDQIFLCVAASPRFVNRGHRAGAMERIESTSRCLGASVPLCVVWQVQSRGCPMQSRSLCP